MPTFNRLAIGVRAHAGGVGVKHFIDDRVKLAAYAEILIARQQIAALQATQAQLQAGLFSGYSATALQAEVIAGFAANANARVASIETAIAVLESRIGVLWTWIDLLL